MTPFETAYIRKLSSEGDIADYVRPGQHLTGIEPYWYNAQFDNFTDSSVVSSALIPTSADSDFLCTDVSAEARLSGAQTMDPMPLIFNQITEQWNGKTWFNVALITRIFAGAAGFPARLQVPRLLQPNSVLQLDAQPFDNRYDTYWVSFSGVRLYYEMGTA